MQHHSEVAATHLEVATGSHRVQRELTHPGIATEVRNGATAVKKQFQISEGLAKCQ